MTCRQLLWCIICTLFGNVESWALYATHLFRGLLQTLGYSCRHTTSLLCAAVVLEPWPRPVTRAGCTNLIHVRSFGLTLTSLLTQAFHSYVVRHVRVGCCAIGCSYSCSYSSLLWTSWMCSTSAVVRFSKCSSMAPDLQSLLGHCLVMLVVAAAAVYTS
jgi:hypothetical protein